MAAPASSNTLTFDEMVKRMDKNEVRAIIELVSQENSMLASVRVQEGNETSGNSTTVRDSLPAGVWTGMSEGVQPEISTTRQIFDSAGTIEAYSVIPMRYLDNSPNSAAARDQETVAFVQGLGENVEDKIFFGDRITNPKHFLGFDKRYDLLAGETGGQIVDAGGTGSDNTDIWFVCWGDLATSLFFGKNGQAGMMVKPLGEQTLDRNNDGKLQQCDVTYYKWEVGLMIEDYRSCARVANLDISDIIGDTHGYNINDVMIDAYYKIPTRFRKMQKAIYCNRDIIAALDKEANSKATVNLTMENWQGEEIVHFRKIPIIQTDSITNVGARIV